MFSASMGVVYIQKHESKNVNLEAQAQAEVGKQLLNAVSRGGKMVTSTKLGQNFAGNMARPMFKDLRKIVEEKSAYRSIAKKQEAEPEKSQFEKIKDYVLEKFAVGDMISVAGLFLYAVQNKFGPEKPGLIGSLFKNFSLLMTFLGSTSAAVGRTFGYDKQVALGDEHASFLINEAQAQGKQIFSVYNEMPGKIDELIKEAQKLDKTLVYKDGLRESILERHEQDEIGGIFDGPHGTGKTDGVKCILGKWANKVRKEGDIPEIVELNLSNFYDFIVKKMQQEQDYIELLKVGLGEKDTKGSYATNQGLMVLEGLVREIQEIRRQVDEHNKNSTGPKKKLAIFVDEFDKALQTKTLEGCDRVRLRNLLIQFNELFVKEDLLLTSNTSVEDMIKDLGKHIKIDENDTGKREVLDPMKDRLTAKNRAFVDFPQAAQQAEIIAGRLLVDYKDNIDWQDFGSQYQPSGNFEYDRKQFAKIIEDEIVAKLETKLNGRQLTYACKQLKSMLLGRARDLNAKSKSFTDEQWEKMSADERISKTGAKIDKDMLAKVISTKVENMSLDYEDKDLEKAFKIFNSYIKSADVTKALQGMNKKFKPHSFIEIDQALGKIFNSKENSTNTVYMAKKPVEYDGKKYQLVLTRYPETKKFEPSYALAFAELGDKEIEDLTMYDFISSKRIARTDFANEAVPTLNRASDSPIAKALSTVLDVIADPNAQWNKDKKQVKEALTTLLTADSKKKAA